MKLLRTSLAVIAPLMLTVTAVMPAVASPPTSGDVYRYDRPGDKDFVNNTNVIERYSPRGGDNRSYKVVADRARGDATFTTRHIDVDGVRDAAWSAATPYAIDNAFTADLSDAKPDATTRGTLRLLWDGPLLYALVEVTGDDSESETEIPDWKTSSYQPDTDGLFVSMDVFNDQWGLETDTQGTFFLGANPAAAPTSFSNSGIPSLGSFFNPANQDYSTRLEAARSSGYTPGVGVNYTYEVALHVEGWGDAWRRELDTGTQVGLEFGVYDADHSFTYWSKTQAFAGREGGSNLPNSERVRNRDWGVATLAGWDGRTPQAYSGWRADEDVRFWDSRSNPGGSGNGTEPDDDGDDSAVWTPATKHRMVKAKAAWLAIRSSATASRARKEAAVKRVCTAFAALRWGDTTYPDPHELPSSQTLPDAFRFFDTSKGTNGWVTNAAQWADRKQELLDLAQFYEYGYKPRLGTDYTVELTGNDYDGTGSPVVTATVTPTNANFSGGRPVDISIPITLPSSVPADQKAAIGFGTTFADNGVADVPFPSWAFDVRSDPYVWGTDRSLASFGSFQFPLTFYTLFPYQRNSTSADSSTLIANATAVSVYLDALHLAVEDNSALAAKIEPDRAVTKGFSINGKYAFVAALFDERVKAVIAGGAGATGPANWRYNAQGQEYDFTGTDYDNPGAEDIVSHGTEGPGNSYRHNRVRETELFRHFLPYGHEYEHEEGSYAYGGYSRLPFDQSLLVATLAPDRAIMIDTNLNDYNDGATTDNMSLQIAKSVYSTLGADAEDLVVFNSGDYQSSGDPHGTVDATPEGKYLSDLLYGTTTLTPVESERLHTDPYALPVSDHRTQNPYDYYWGGYNTITGGQNGVDGVDGWSWAGFDAELAGLRSQIKGLDIGRTRTAALLTQVDRAGKLHARGQDAKAVRRLARVVAGLRRAGSGDGVTRSVGAAARLVLFLRSSHSAGGLAPLPDKVGPEVSVKQGAGFTVGSGGRYSKVSFKLHDPGRVDRLTLNGVVKDLTDDEWSDLNFVVPGRFGAVEGRNTLVVFDTHGNSTAVRFTLDVSGPDVSIKKGARYTVGSGGRYAKVSFKLHDPGRVDRLTLNGVVKDLADDEWSDLNFVGPGRFGAVEGRNTLVVYDAVGNSTTTRFTLRG